jgi:HD-like signal output (HDOD) protein
MTPDAVLARIAESPRLPALPHVALRVIDRASDPNCNVHELGKIIAGDPALCVKLLRLVNSSLLGLSRAVTSIERATGLLGLNRLRALVLSLTMPALRLPHAPRARVQQLWRASVTEAIVCRELAIRGGSDDPDSELVAGLLCEIGTLILQEVMPDGYAHVLAESPGLLRDNQCDIERRVLGVTHAEVGAHVLKLWGLPAELTEPIRCHHDPAGLTGPLGDRAQRLFFAGRIAQLQFKVSYAFLPGEIIAVARDRFGIGDDQLITFLEMLKAKVDEFATFLEVGMDPCDNFASLFATATESLTRLAAEASLEQLRIHAEKVQAEEGKRRAEEALEESEKRLEQARQTDQVYLLGATITHDINSLMAVINGYGAYLLATLPKTDPRRGPVEQMRQAGQRVAELNRQLAALCRPDLTASSPAGSGPESARTRPTKVVTGSVRTASG